MRKSLIQMAGAVGINLRPLSEVGSLAMERVSRLAIFPSTHTSSNSRALSLSVKAGLVTSHMEILGLAKRCFASCELTSLMIRIAPAALAWLPSPFRAVTASFRVSLASAREMIRLRMSVSSNAATMAVLA